MIEANFDFEAGMTDSFMDFIKKFKIGLPSKEKAKKTLKKYTVEDIGEAYKSIPKILTMFKTKKSDFKEDREQDVFFTQLQRQLIKNVMILICLISLANGILPKNPDAAEEKLKSEKIFYKDFDYMGKILVDDVLRFVDKEDSFEKAKEKITKAIKNKSIAFEGELPEDVDIKVYKDRVSEITSTKELLEYSGVYFKLGK